MRTDTQWHLTKSIPVTLILTILLQTFGAVWWASSINSKLDALYKDFDAYQEETSSENLRQWSRINSNETAVESVVSTTKVNNAILSRVEKDLSDTRKEIGRTNELIREYLGKRD